MNNKEEIYDGCTVKYTEEPFCEHCGENFDDFAVVFDDDGIERCYACFTCEHELTVSESKFINEKERLLTIDYYEKKIKKLKENE